MENKLDFVDYHEIIECISSALDAKDPYTANHSLRVSDIVQVICKLIGINEDDTNEIHIAAHLHDIGKIGIPDAILCKSGPLNDYEWNIMKEHPAMGSEILSKSKRLLKVSQIVRSHHERFDGKGYPDGLAGEKIPIGSRIIAISDSIDAMTTKRSYREANSFEYAYSEIAKNLGLMYDPIVGEYVLEHWNEIISNTF